MLLACHGEPHPHCPRGSPLGGETEVWGLAGGGSVRGAHPHPSSWDPLALSTLVGDTGWQKMSQCLEGGRVGMGVFPPQGWVATQGWASGPVVCEFAFSRECGWARMPFLSRGPLRHWWGREGGGEGAVPGPRAPKSPPALEGACTSWPAPTPCGAGLPHRYIVVPKPFLLLSALLHVTLLAT